MYKLENGIWTFFLNGEYINGGRFDAWLPQRKIIGPGTTFGSINRLTTATIPSVSQSVISVGYYNQTNDTSISDSGRGFTVDGRVVPLIVAGGVSQRTVDVGGGMTIVSGSSVATAVIAGSCALILECVLAENKGYMNVQSLKGILALTAVREKNSLYPNPTYGYGIFDLENTFKRIR